MPLHCVFARNVERKWLVRVIRSTLLSGYLETHSQLIDLANEAEFFLLCATRYYITRRRMSIICPDLLTLMVSILVRPT